MTTYWFNSPYYFGQLEQKVIIISRDVKGVLDTTLRGVLDVTFWEKSVSFTWGD